MLLSHDNPERCQGQYGTIDRDKFTSVGRGLVPGYCEPLLWLTTANPLTFYFEQYGNVALALIQLAVLAGLIYYQGRYVEESDDRQSADQQQKQARQSPPRA
jgi:hypothetical protein